MTIRQAFRAGSFYQASPEKCRQEAEVLIAAAPTREDLPQVLCGGLVPHAGWPYSGRLAAETLATLARAGGEGRTFVMFGADHTGSVSQGEVFDSGAWRSPLGDMAVDEDLASLILAGGTCLRANPDAHATEHSIEVQLPLLQALDGAARILPIAVPPTPLAVEIGQAVGSVLAEQPERAMVVGSTDLTHHGGHFGSPGGHGATGERWTRENDRRMLDLIESMSADQVIGEAQQQRNACGAGAIAATIAACKCLGATRGVCIEYTNSYEVIRAIDPDYRDDTTVGYASVVFGA